MYKKSKSIRKGGAFKSKATVAPPKLTTAIRKSMLPSYVEHLDEVQQQYVLKNKYGQPIVFNSLVALCYDMNVAIVLNRMIFWCDHNKRNDLNFKDGRYWTYNSIREIRIRYLI